MVTVDSYRKRFREDNRLLNTRKIQIVKRLVMTLNADSEETIYSGQIDVLFL